jgi:hypothetical protein
MKKKTERDREDTTKSKVRGENKLKNECTTKKAMKIKIVQGRKVRQKRKT